MGNIMGLQFIPGNFQTFVFMSEWVRMDVTLYYTGLKKQVTAEFLESYDNLKKYWQNSVKLLPSQQ